MGSHHLELTARTTLDLVEMRSVGTDWREDGLGVVDVEVPPASETVLLEFELDPDDCDRRDHHADVVELTPHQARKLAADLERGATTVEDGGSMTSGRSRSAIDG